MIPQLLSKKTGRIILSTDTNATPLSSGWNSFISQTVAGSIRLMLCELRLFQVELLQIKTTKDDFIQLSPAAFPYTLHFTFLNSCQLYPGEQSGKVIHDRGCNLLLTGDDPYRLSCKKDTPYLFISIRFGRELIIQQGAIFPSLMSLISLDRYKTFFYSRSPLVNRQCFDLLSTLLYYDPPWELTAFLRQETVIDILNWFKERNTTGNFHPSTLHIEDATTFYVEKDNLLKHRSKTITYRELLSAAGILNESIFRKRLKQLYGLTIREFLTEARMADAQLLLKNEELSLKQIAFMTGFSNIFYFTRVFAHYFGEPPNAYRQRQRL